ncbi:MAG: cytochrome c3 family protein [bacterium]|nr:cytochrome c3 family protein [bacterium]
MKTTLLILSLALTATVPATGQVARKSDSGSCAACHAGLDAKNRAIVRGYEKDVHFERGLLCSDCHGGDPAVKDEDAMDPAKGFVGTPEWSKIPEFCARCHSNPAYMRHFNPLGNVDQLEKYRTSRHGILLAKGDKKVAVCTSCHGVHGTLAVDNPNSPVYRQNIPQTCNRCHGDAAYMAPYRIPTDQYGKYARSVHGVALLEKHTKGAPACNDCHGNHGAVPPGVNDIEAVCVICHSINGELYDQSPHRDAFKAAGFKQCAQCHDHHLVFHPTDAMLGVGEGATCVECHSPGEAGYVAAARMRQFLDSLEIRQTQAKSLLDSARVLDMDVADGEALVEAIRQNLIEARTATHAFSDKHLAEVGSKGLVAAQKADSLARAAIFEHKFRRLGFGVATLIITGTALLLFLKIRQIERRKRKPPAR